jgi:hypothetical protein
MSKLDSTNHPSTNYPGTNHSSTDYSSNYDHHIAEDSGVEYSRVCTVDGFCFYQIVSSQNGDKLANHEPSSGPVIVSMNSGINSNTDSRDTTNTNAETKGKRMNFQSNRSKFRGKR